jgi:hypothetical protein
MAFRRALTVVLPLLLAAQAAWAQEPAPDIQRRVKAAFVYKFAAFVDWPDEAFASATSPMIIGVAGADRVAKELEQAVAGREVAGHPILVRRIQAGDALGDCCQILFVGASLPREQARELLLQQVGKRPVLTVTEARGDPPAGSVINFVEADDRVRFDISRPAAEAKGLKLRSQLLAVARQVVSQ